VTVDWSTEWFTSLVWIVGVTIAALVGCVIAVALLTRFTVWGRQFRRLAFPFFSPRGPEGWRPLLNAFAVLLFVIIAVRVQVVNSYITNGLYTALQELDAATFGRYILIFSVLSVVALAQTLLA
jgi:putative ATP-binding cassette transporter